MSSNNSLALVLLAGFLPSATVSALLVASAAAAVWSGDPERRARARQILRLIVRVLYPRSPR